MYESIIHALNHLPEHPKTKTVRNLSKPYKNILKDVPIETVYELCETLLKTGEWAHTILAYQLIYDQRTRYNKDTFTIFDHWTKTYIKDWWDCDDFMTHAVKELLIKYPEFIPHTFLWMTHHEFAVRRSTPVSLIRLAQQKLLPFSTIKHVCDTLLYDPHYLVQKGFGWLLKESSKEYHDEVVNYLLTNHKNISRTAFRYAIEKLPKEERTRLMAL